MFLPLPLLALQPIIFGAADFVTGRDYIKRLGLPGRSIWWVAPPLVILFVLLGGWTHCGLIPLTWALWRSVLGWSTFGVRTDSRTAADDALMMVRDLVSGFPICVVLIYCMGVHWALAIAAVCIFALGAMLTNAWYGYEMARFNRDVDPEVDAVHGILFGLMIWGVLWLQAAGHHP